MSSVEILQGDALTRLREIPASTFRACVTSPPYFRLRDYGYAGQIGQENTVDAYVTRLVSVFREVRRALRADGTLWLNLGDCYVDKQRLLIPARVALALQSDGWILRDEIVWHKPRTTPAPVKDRTVAAHEMLYVFSTQPRYFYDWAALEEPSAYAGVVRKAGRAFRTHGDAKAKLMAENRKIDVYYQDPSARLVVVRDTRRARSVWSVSPSPYRDAHFATMPPEIARRCIVGGSQAGDAVLDPFGGAGTTGLVAKESGRSAVLIDMNPDYCRLMRRRLGQTTQADRLCESLSAAAAGLDEYD